MIVYLKLLSALLLIDSVFANENVIVMRLVLNLEQQYTFGLNSSVEYMLDFIPNPEQRQYPSQFSIRTDGGDTTHPLLITARQRIGAVTYQLPYESSGQLLYEMTRTLCFSRTSDGNSNCDEAVDSLDIHSSFSLQISSTCSEQLNINVLAAPVRMWNLPFQAVSSVEAGLTTPSVQYYKFSDDQSSVRLALESSDDVCALVSVQNYTCPVLQTEELIPQAGQRMTMLRSAGVHIPRSRYPNGFYLVVVVQSSDTQCTGVDVKASYEQDWLWEAVWGQDAGTGTVPPRLKRLRVTVEASLTRSQYAIASAVTLIIFLLFYVLFFVLVYAQRWPTFGKHVWPKVPPAENNVPAADPQHPQTEVDAASVETSHRRRRLDSTATWDSSEDSNSDSDSDTPAAPHTPATAPRTPAGSPESPQQTRDNRTSELERADTLDGTPPPSVDTNGVQPAPPQVTTEPDSTPFGLPPSLRLDALSRHRSRVLRARSDRYLHTLYTVAVFYALPVLQFVSAFQIFLNVSGSLDTCYYNFLCSHPLGGLSDFNHVFSNLGYLLLGALFMLQLRRRRLRRQRRPRSEEYGIPAHYGMLSSLGAAMMVVGLLSASYHVCPNRLNFQFDTAFMYVLAVVSMVTIYQSRHPDVNARAHATFGVLAVLIALVVWGVLGGGAFFWAIFTVLHLFTFLLISLRIYYVGQFRLERETLQMAARGIAQMPKYGVRPLYKTRLIMLLIANGINWAIGLYGLWLQAADIASHLLQLLLANTLLYMIFYLVMKMRNGERPRWYSWCFLAGASVCWGPALYFFVAGSSDWSTTPALSRHMNHECVVLKFYDAHDMWHMMSAVALYLSFNAMLTWDDGLAAVKRTEIAVF